MLDEDLIAAAKSGGLKLLPSIANELTGGVVDEWKAKLLANGSSRLAAAWERERDDLLWSIVGAMTAVASAVHGAQLTPDQAMDVLVRLGGEPATRRRLRALFQEAATSTDERIAMLAVGYFVGAAEPSLQERLDWSLRALFPCDADALGVVAEFQSLAGDDGYVVVRTSGAWHPSASLRAKPGTSRIRMAASNPDVFASLNEGRSEEVSVESLRSLSAARCVDVVPGGDGFRTTAPKTTRKNGRTIVAPTTSRHDSIEAQSMRLLPLGRLLHANLSKVDWREIANRRRTV